MGNKLFSYRKPRKPVIDRLNKKSIIDKKTNCWIYNGSDTGINGYGTIHYIGKMITVHRLSAHLYLGLNLDNKEEFALHKRECTNKKCWNPDHLYIGTRSENSLDREALKRELKK